MAVEELDGDGLKKFASSSGESEVCVVDFWAEWCGPCKSLAPILDSLAQKYEGVIKVAKINIGKMPEVGARYSITNIPCIVVFKNGKEIDRMVGFKGKDGLDGFLSKHAKGS